MIFHGQILPRLKRLARQALQRAGLEVHRRSSRTPSVVFDDPYEALFARNHRTLFRFPSRLCVDKLGFSYGSWQPWVETVRQLRVPERLTYEQSVIKAFYDAWSFPLLHDVFGAKIPQEKLRNHLLKIFHGGFMPFSRTLGKDLMEAVEADTRYLESDNRNAGFPLSIDQSLNEDGTWTDIKGEIELKRLTALLQAIENHGYVRDDGLDGDISGYLLRRNGSLRFVVMWGLHRTSVLSALNNQQLTVRLFVNMIVDLDSIGSWPLVTQGVWTQDQAQRYFHHLFDFESENWARGKGFL